MKTIYRLMGISCAIAYVSAANIAAADDIRAGGKTDGTDFNGDIEALFSDLDLSQNSVPYNYLVGGNATTNGYTGAVNGSINMTLSNVNLGANGCIVGGNYSYPNWGDGIEGIVGGISGDITMNLNNVQAYNVFGDNMISSVVKEADYSRLPRGVENLTINIDGADTNIARAVRGSNAYNGYNDTAALASTAIKNTVINMKNGYVGTIMPVTGGSYAGNSQINVSGGKVGTIIGSIGGIIGGNYGIRISGGEIAGDVVGGFEAVDGDRNYSAVKGNVLITVGSSANTVKIGGNILAGGMDSATTVEGGATVAFVGKGENLDFAGTVYGAGLDGSKVNGTKTVAFGNGEENFTGRFGGALDGFDVLSVGQGSDVLLSQSVSVDVLSVYSAAKIGFAETLARAAQELAFNRLEVVLADGFQQGDNVDFGEIFGDSVALSTLTADSITVKDSSGNRVEEFKVSTDSEGHITGITDIVAVPEPSMFAALFGVFALAAAAARRR